MKRGFIFINILIVFLQGCKKEISYSDKFTLLSDKNRIEIVIDSNSRNISKCIQYLSFNDSNYLAVANENFNSIEFYNLDAKKLFKKIFIKTEGDNSFYQSLGFVAKNMDTILAVSQMPQFIGMINGRGDVLKKISYSKDIEGKRIQMTIPYSGMRPFFANNNLFLSQYYRADESSGVLTSSIQKQSFLNVKVDLNTGECQLMPLVYPDELIGRNIFRMDINRVIGFDDCLVYHFGIIQSLFISTNNINFEKRVIETNYQLKLPENYGKYLNNILSGNIYGITHDEIKDILYDCFRECYYLIVRKRINDSNIPEDLSINFIYPDCFIIILDKNLKHMGDVYLEDNTYSFKMMFITPKGLYISEDHVNNPTFDEEYMRFRLFTLEKL